MENERVGAVDLSASRQMRNLGAVSSDARDENVVRDSVYFCSLVVEAINAL